MLSKHDGIAYYSPYLGTVYQPTLFRATFVAVCECVSKILKENPKVRAIAFRGSSGAALAYPVALHLDLGLIHVRKERSHSRRDVEGVMLASGHQYIIIDDFVDTGETLTKIATTVGMGKLSDVVLYKQPEYNIPEYPVSTFNTQNYKKWNVKNLPKFHLLFKEISEKGVEWRYGNTKQER